MRYNSKLIIFLSLCIIAQVKSSNVSLSDSVDEVLLPDRRLVSDISADSNRKMNIGVINKDVNRTNNEMLNISRSIFLNKFTNQTRQLILHNKNNTNYSKRENKTASSVNLRNILVNYSNSCFINDENTSLTKSISDNVIENNINKLRGRSDIIDAIIADRSTTDANKVLSVIRTNIDIIEEHFNRLPRSGIEIEMSAKDERENITDDDEILTDNIVEDEINLTDKYVVAIYNDDGKDNSFLFTKRAVDTPHFRVINGVPANPGEIPYQISFRLQARGHFSPFSVFCGGSLISSQRILSAAHCFESFSQSIFCDRGRIKADKLRRVQAVAGSTKNYEKKPFSDTAEAQWRNLKNVWFPTGYKFPKMDIALVTVIKPYFLNQNIRPIPYSATYEDFRGSCLASGFGRTAYSKYGGTAPYLLKANLEMIPAMYCDQLHRKKMHKFICTNTAINNVAQGDSGGPLVCHGLLVGVVSGAIERRGGYKIARYTFFTRVSAYSRFISKSEASRIHALSSLTCLAYFITFLVFQIAFIS